MHTAVSKTRTTVGYVILLSKRKQEDENETEYATRAKNLIQQEAVEFGE